VASIARLDITSRRRRDRAAALGQTRGPQDRSNAASARAATAALRSPSPSRGRREPRRACRIASPPHRDASRALDALAQQRGAGAMPPRSAERHATSCRVIFGTRTRRTIRGRGRCAPPIAYWSGPHVDPRGPGPPATLWSGYTRLPARPRSSSHRVGDIRVYVYKYRLSREPAHAHACRRRFPLWESAFSQGNQETFNPSGRKPHPGSRPVPGIE